MACQNIFKKCQNKLYKKEKFNRQNLDRHYQDSSPTPKKSENLTRFLEIYFNLSHLKAFRSLLLVEVYVKIIWKCCMTRYSSYNLLLKVRQFIKGENDWTILLNDKPFIIVIYLITFLYYYRTGQHVKCLQQFKPFQRVPVG